MEYQSQVRVIIGVALLYAAGRAGVDAVAGNGAAPGRRALGYWMPIAAVALLAVFFNQPAMAVAIIFATSVGTLSLVGGCAFVMGMTHAEPAAWPQRTRTMSGLMLPAAVLALLAGFAGHISRLSTIILLIEGAMLLYVWRDRSEEEQEAGERQALNLARLIVSLGLAGGGAWGAVTGTIGLSHLQNFPSPNIVATTALAPLLIAPVLLGGAALAQRGQAWAAAGTHIAIAQLNLCLLLPAAAIAWRLRWRTPLGFPMANWRVDAVVLVLLAAAGLPWAAGRWRPGRLEGAALIAIYVAYVLATIAVSVRS